MDKLSYKLLRQECSTIADAHDPIGLIELGAPAGEYDAEIGTILPKLVRCADEAEVFAIVRDEFIRWFGDTADIPDFRYRALAKDLWIAREVFALTREPPPDRGGTTDARPGPR